MNNSGECYLDPASMVAETAAAPLCVDGGGSSWVLHSYRPRGSLARTLYEKQMADNYLNNFDKSQWYHCDLKYLPPSIADRFVQLNADDDTLRFLQRSEDKSEWILTQVWHSVAKAFLSWFMSQTSINGWLKRGSMFVLSFSQFLTLLGKDASWRKQSLLDLGAGDGHVTASLAPSFDDIYATEISTTMQGLLKKRGYRVLGIKEWYKGKKFDMISCLNLLDRCDCPLELLHQMKEALKPGGMALVAVVLPFSAYVEMGSANHKPTEVLSVAGETFEQQVVSFIDDILSPVGFEVISWTRVPYLCEGDLRQSYYWLDDAIFLIKTT